jgi:hypothetical protein
MNTIKMPQRISHDPQLEKVLYTGKTHTTGGRDGASPGTSGSFRAARKEIQERLMKARHYLQVSSWIIGKQRYSITK